MSVWRDPWGVPHVRGGSPAEVAFEQGRVTAEDRPEQLEAERLRGEGRSGEQEWDTFATRVGIAEVARRAFDGLGEESRGFVTSYVDGVRTVLPQWQSWTPLAVFWVQQVLFANYPTALWQQHVRETAGPEVAEALRMEGLPNGSNAFAVTGARTASGLPLVAGDPHRIFETPGIYAQVQLTCPEFDVVGLTFPGVPGVQHFGHTGHVAWAVTNAMADYQDVGPDGGLVSPAAVLGDLGLEALLPLLRARSVADVDAALEHWVEPVNNVVVADTAGRVLHRVAGRVPVRGAGGDWAGWTVLPRREIPDGQVAVSANDRADASYAVLGDGFAAPWRRDRITELLAGFEELDVPAATGILTDTRQLGADRLLELVAAVQVTSPEAARLRERLLGWDRRMDAGSIAAALYAAVRAQVVELLVAAEVLAPLRAPCPHGDLFAPWFDLRVRVAAALPGLLASGTPFGLDAADVVARAVRAVAADPPAGTWGDQHRLVGTGRPLAGDSECVAATGWLPGRVDVLRGPVARYVFDLADRTRSRWAVPEGPQVEAWAGGELVPVEPFTLEPVDPGRDAGLIHGWVTCEYARFWGMSERTVEEVEEIYAYLADQAHLSARLIRIEGAPVGILQTYDPFVDEIGEHYDRRPGDLGVHLFLADDPARAGMTPSLMEFALAEIFADPAVRRIVLEPDVANEKSQALLRRLGVTLGPVVTMPEKTAQFAFLPRPGG